jgi:hypothetical protein
MSKHLIRRAGAGLLALALAAAPARAQQSVQLRPWEFKAVRTLERSGEPEQREEAARLLARSGRPRLIPILAHAAAYDPNGNVREEAGEAVQSIRRDARRWDPPPMPRPERPLVARRYQGREERVREVRNKLDTLERAQRPFRREEAVRDLEQDAGTGVIPVLAWSAAYDPDPAVRAHAGRAIVFIARREGAWSPPRWPDSPFVQGNVPDSRVPLVGDLNRPPAVDPAADRVHRAFRRYLNREPSADDVRTWSAHLRRGGDYFAMLGTLLASEEYWARSNADPRTLVIRLYADMLRRQPTEQEVQEWLRNFAAFRDRNRFVQTFIAGAQREFTQNGFRL